MRKTLLVGLLLVPATLVAQEKLALRASPKPNQVIRFTMTQYLDFDVTMPGGTMGAMKVGGQMVFSGLQKVGAPDAKGQISAEITMDTVTMNVTMNGAPTGSPGLGDQLVGKTFTVIYDREGKVVDVKSPPGTEAMGDPKQMISSITGLIPTGMLAVGDSVTIPLSIPIPVPLPGTKGPTSLDSKVTSKLTGITSEGGDRIATLAQTTEGQLNSPGSGLELKMTGTGTVQLNVDKGFVKTGDSTAKMDVSMLMQGMAMKMNGTVHVVMTGTSRPAP